jgi:murein DD-endopeptidase MepM/ murein hydrolase activator NlpD
MFAALLPKLRIPLPAGGAKRHIARAPKEVSFDMPKAALAIVLLIAAPWMTLAADTLPPDMRFAWPVCGRVDQGFGYRVDPLTHRIAFHSGIDMAMPLGVPVRAAATGKIIAAEERGSYGLMIEIDNGNGYRTRYGHLQSFGVQVGQTVDRGQVIGSVGSSGRSKSPHLHFEIWLQDIVRDPLKYLEPEATCMKR